MALEVSVVRRTAALGPGQPEPGRIAGVAAIRDRALEARMFTPDMVEDAVEHNTQAARFRGGDQGVEITDIAEPRINPEVIGRVIAVSGRCEDRREKQAGDTEIDGVVEPIDQMAQAMVDRRIRS